MVYCLAFLFTSFLPICGLFTDAVFALSIQKVSYSSARFLSVLATCVGFSSAVIMINLEKKYSCEDIITSWTLVHLISLIEWDYLHFFTHLIGFLFQMNSQFIPRQNKRSPSLHSPKQNPPWNAQKPSPGFPMLHQILYAQSYMDNEQFSCPFHRNLLAHLSPLKWTKFDCFSVFPCLYWQIKLLLLHLPAWNRRIYLPQGKLRHDRQAYRKETALPLSFLTA